MSHRQRLTPEQSGAASIEPVGMRPTETLRAWEETLLRARSLTQFQWARLYAIREELARREHGAHQDAPGNATRTVLPATKPTRT